MAAAVGPSADRQPPLVVIVGPTASGKTDVALRLAADFNGEIIAADSRTVYRGLDIGTAKPTPQERIRVPHHLIDIINPDETYTAGRFQADARTAIAEIRDRGRVPFVVGGSGLYVDGLVFDYTFGPAADPALRQRLETMDIAQLTAYCIENDIAVPHNSLNKRYLVRAIEQGGVNVLKRSKPLENTVIVGIATEKEALERRISQRAAAMFVTGLADEAARAGEKFGWNSDPLRAPAYRASKELIEGNITTQEAVDRLIAGDKKLAKKQRTWFKRNEHIIWLPAGDVYPFVAQTLDGEHMRATL